MEKQLQNQWRCSGGQRPHPGRRGWGRPPGPALQGRAVPGPPSTGPQEVASIHPVLLAESESSARERPQPPDGGATEDAAAFAFGPTWPLVPGSREGPTGRLGQQLLLVCAREAAGASDPEQMLPGGRLRRPPPPADGSSVDRTPHDSEAGW